MLKRPHREHAHSSDIFIRGTWHSKIRMLLRCSICDARAGADRRENLFVFVCACLCISLSLSLSLCVCVCARARACVFVCVYACVHTQ